MERFIKNLARGAGAVLRDGFHTKFAVSTKSASFDFVTEYDLASEKFIIDRIRKKYPKHGIIGEESGEVVHGKKDFWLIDPLDGTHAFVKGIPQFGVSIAYVKSGQVHLGAVYDPMQDELFFAKAGHGAFLENRRIEIAHRKDLAHANIVSMIRSNLDASTRKRILKHVYNKIIIEHMMWTDRMSSAALCGAYVASGRFDFMVSMGLRPWDYAAAALLVVEAGGKVTDFDDKKYSWKKDEFVAGNRVLHKKILKLLPRA